MKREGFLLMLAFIILGGILSFTLLQFRAQWLAGDEALFIRITDRLPSYESRAEWWTRDGVTDPDEAEYLPDTEFYHAVQTAPVWRHPPGASYMAYPFVKLLWNEESVEAIDRSIERLRIVAWAILAFCILAALYVLRRERGEGKVFLFAMLPLLAAVPLFMQEGSNWFYHDVFLIAMVMTALLMRGTKYEKFMFIPLALMVVTKVYAVLFLLPFVIENRRLALCALALVPYQLHIWIVTGNFFWLFEHWALVSSFTPPNDMSTIDHLLAVVASAGSIVPFWVVTGVPLVYLVYKAVRRESSWFLPILFLVAVWPMVKWAARYYEVLPLYYYQSLPMIVIGMLVMGKAVMLLGQKKEGGFSEKLA